MSRPRMVSGLVRSDPLPGAVHLNLLGDVVVIDLGHAEGWGLVRLPPCGVHVVQVVVAPVEAHPDLDRVRVDDSGHQRVVVS